MIITDALVGNVMLKLTEGLSAGIFRAIAREVSRVDPDLACRFEPVVKRIYAQHDYHEYGGAPLLGVKGICLIGHGSSEARTITNAILGSKRLVQTGINEPRYVSIRGIRKVSKMEIPVQGAADLGVDAGSVGAVGALVSVEELFLPPKGEGAEMLDGDDEEMVEQLVAKLREQGVV